jgi:hypothetical protein
MAVIAAAGPAASLLGALATGAMVSSDPTSRIAQVLAIATVFGVAGGCVANLLPIRVVGGRGAPSHFESDGLQLFHAVSVLVELRRWRVG